MKHYLFNVGLDEFDDATGVPGFACRETADGKMLLPERGAWSIETIFKLAEHFCERGLEWRDTLKLIDPIRLEVII